jgi:hypothetical protein
MFITSEYQDKGKKENLFLYLISQSLSHENIQENGGIAQPFVTLALDESEWSASHPGHFTSREITPGTHWIGGPRAGLDAVAKRKSPTPAGK